MASPDGRGNNPLYWIRETIRMGRNCARKYPLTAWSLPTVVSFGCGLIFMECTNPVARTDLTSSLVTHVAPSSSDSSWKMNENAVDKYDLSLRPEPKRHKTWQGQYVQDMLDGLKNKTTDQKLDDAFDALDHFMGPGAKKNK